MPVIAPRGQTDFAADHPGFGGPLPAFCFGADGESVDNLQA